MSVQNNATVNMIDGIIAGELVPSKAKSAEKADGLKGALTVKVNGEATCTFDGAQAAEVDLNLFDHTSMKIGIGQDVAATGVNTVAVGTQARAAGVNAVAVGRLSAATLTESIAIGVSAQAKHIYTVALGKGALSSADSCVAVGKLASASAGNAMALGAGAVADTANTICLGNDKITTLKCNADLTVTSDERDKADIEKLDKGAALALIEGIDSVRYVNNSRARYAEGDFRKDGYDRDAHARGEKKGERKRVGVLAQQVRQKLISLFGTDNYADLVNDSAYDGNRSEEENQLSVRYSAFIPFFFFSVQALSERVQTLERDRN